MRVSVCVCQCVCVSVCVCVHVRVLHHTRLYMCVYYMHALLEYNSFLIAFHFAWLIWDQSRVRSPQDNGEPPTGSCAKVAARQPRAVIKYDEIWTNMIKCFQISWNRVSFRILVVVCYQCWSQWVNATISYYPYIIYIYINSSQVFSVALQESRARLKYFLALGMQIGSSLGKQGKKKSQCLKMALTPQMGEFHRENTWTLISLIETIRNI